MADPIIRIPETAILSFISACALAAIGWAFKNARKLTRTATMIDSHEKTCLENQRRITTALQTIDRKIEAQNTETRQSRAAQATMIGAIQVSVGKLEEAQRQRELAELRQRQELR